jgi:hypothetical protein
VIATVLKTRSVGRFHNKFIRAFLSIESITY